MEVNTPISQKTWLSVAELKAYIGLTKKTIYTYVSRRILPHYKRGRILRFRRTEIDSWLGEGKIETSQEYYDKLFRRN